MKAKASPPHFNFCSFVESIHSVRTSCFSPPNLWNVVGRCSARIAPVKIIVVDYSLCYPERNYQNCFSGFKGHMNKKYIQFDPNTVGNPLLEQASFFQKSFEILETVTASLSLKVAAEFKMPSYSHLRPVRYQSFTSSTYYKVTLAHFIWWEAFYPTIETCTSTKIFPSSEVT